METKEYIGVYAPGILIKYQETRVAKKLILNVNNEDVYEVMVNSDPTKLTSRKDTVPLLYKKIEEVPGLPISAKDITKDKMDMALGEIASEINNDRIQKANDLEEEFKRLEKELFKDSEAKCVEYKAMLEELGMTPIEHLLNLSSWFAANESINITAGVLATISTLWGFIPIWIQIVGAAGSGKTKIEESILEMIPSSQIIYGESTLPALYAQAEMDPYFFDRKILSLGDMGSEKDLERNEDLFNIGKKLYTDKQGTARRKMEKPEKNAKNEMVLEEIKGHCSIIFTTVQELTDTQHVSRMISINPLDDMGAFDEYSRYMSTLTPISANRKKILKEAELLKGMIYYYGTIYKDLDFDLINPYYETIIKWTNNLPEPKRAREQVDALLKVIVLFNNNEKQKYVMDNGKIIYVISKDDINLFERLFRLNVGVSVEAMNFFQWIASKNRNKQYRVHPLIEDEEYAVTASGTFDEDYKSLFTVKSIRKKVNANQRAFNRKKIAEYCDQLVDIGLVNVIIHDKEASTHDRIMCLDPYSAAIVSNNIPFEDEDIWQYMDKFGGTHIWLDEDGKDWVMRFVLSDLHSNIKNTVKRAVPWEAVL